jgi:hypothetical protein
MPAGFERCREQGGRIRTIKPTADTYMPICYLKGKSYRGELHHTKKGGTAQAIKDRMGK